MLFDGALWHLEGERLSVAMLKYFSLARARLDSEGTWLLIGVAF